MVNFYSPDCYINKWNDLTSYSLSELIDFSKSDRIIDRIIGISAMNAYSQHIFEEISFEFDFENDVLDKLKLSKSDVVGMVGKFTPWIPKIVSKVKKLTVIEKDIKKLGNFDDVKIISDPSILEDVDVAIITGTSLINHTIDDLLKLAGSARTAVIGPSMGMIPDPFFKAGADIIGGMKFLDINKIMQLISEGGGTMRFKNFAKKYIIEEKHYSKL